MEVVQLELWPLEEPERAKIQIWRDVPPEARVTVIAKLSELLARTEFPQNPAATEGDNDEC